MTPEQVEAFPFGDFDKQRDLGDGHWYALTSCGTSCPGEGSHGLIQPHLKADGTWCGGAVTFAGHDPGKRRDGAAWVPGPTWDVVSLEPLHLEPSLACTAEGCGDHGFIRDGRWVPA